MRLIVERERERDAFTPDEYWRIGGVFTNDLGAAGDIAQRFGALLAQRDEKGKPPTKDAQQQFLSSNSSLRLNLPAGRARNSARTTRKFRWKW